jgi:hypothetical protein
MMLLNAIGEQEPSSDADQPASTGPNITQPIASPACPLTSLPGQNCNASRDSFVNQEHDLDPNEDTIVLDPEPELPETMQTPNQKLKASDTGHQRPLQMQLSYILNP